MLEQEELKTRLEAVYNQINQYLEEGVTYYSTPIVVSYGVLGGTPYTIEDGIKSRIRGGFDDDLDLFNITSKFPAQTIVKYTFRKGQPITAEACKPELLLEQMKLDLRSKRMDSVSNVEIEIKFIKKKKVQTEAVQRVTIEDKVHELDFSDVDDILPCLYQAVDGKLKKMYISFDGEQFKFQSTPVIPGLTTEIEEKKIDLTLDASRLEAIYEFMESSDEQKIAKALDVLKDNPEFYAKAQQRYLSFVRARTDNAGAPLEDFAKAALSKSEEGLLLGNHFAKDFFSFSYFSDEESKAVVDFIGSIVQNAVDLDAYIQQARTLSSESELAAHYRKTAEVVKSKILQEAAVYPEGWFSRISAHLASINLGRVLFEKTAFDAANHSLVLKEYMLFLNLNSDDSVYFDVYQSEEPDLTEVFWMLPEVPRSNWLDTTLTIPDSTLSFQRAAWYKLEDDGDWMRLSKP